MCRGVNIYVCLKHLVWRADAFGISFPHVKNDPAGSRNWHPRHFYTNPDSYPVYCVRDGNCTLFQGPKQEEQFGAILLVCMLEKHKE